MKKSFFGAKNVYLCSYKVHLDHQGLIGTYRWYNYTLLYSNPNGAITLFGTSNGSFFTSSYIFAVIDRPAFV